MNTSICTRCNSYRQLYCYVLQQTQSLHVAGLFIPKWFFLTFILWKWNGKRKKNNKNHLPKLQIKKPWILSYVSKSKLRLYIAWRIQLDLGRQPSIALYASCPPPRLQYWSSLNRLKCYRGSHHKIQLASPWIWYLQMSEITGLRRLMWALTATRAHFRLSINQKLSVRASVALIVCAEIFTRRYMQTPRACPLSICPPHPPRELNRGKERCQRVCEEKTHVNDFVNARLHSVKNVNPL